MRFRFLVPSFLLVVMITFLPLISCGVVGTDIDVEVFVYPIDSPEKEKMYKK